MKPAQLLSWVGGVGASAVALACCALGPAVVAGSLVGGIAAVTLSGWAIGGALGLVVATAVVFSTRLRSRRRGQMVGTASSSGGRGRLPVD